MKGKIIAVDYAKTNNLNHKSVNDSFYVKKNYGYVCYEKGMGSAGGDDTPTWKPKKSESQRLIGKPGEIKETFNQKGERFLTKIGKTVTQQRKDTIAITAIMENTPILMTTKLIGVIIIPTLAHQ